MDKSKAVHQCLFCQQTFDSATDKDDHILEHFDQEKCAECNEDLIRIGGYLYARHDKATCIKKTAIPEVSIESCTTIESMQMTPKPHATACDGLNSSQNSLTLDTTNKSEIKRNRNRLESISSIRGNNMMASVFVDRLSIQKRFPHVNLNPVVVLEDFRKNIVLLQPSESNLIKIEKDSELEIGLECISHIVQGNQGYPSKHIDEIQSTLGICYTHVQPIEELESQQSVVSNHQEEDNLIGMEFEVKMEDLPIEFQPNDCDEGIVMQNTNEFHEIPYQTNSKEFVCEICKREFSKLNSRRRHGIRVKLFKCRVCGISCADQLQLQIHAEAVHSDIRRFKCNTCGISFKKKDHLIDHKRRHSDETPFKCSYEGCDKSFKIRRFKVQHERTHSGERPYVCRTNDCGLDFARHHQLMKHKKEVHGISKPKYSCGYCSEMFTLKTNLAKHFEEKHSNLEISSTQHQQIDHAQPQEQQMIISSHQDDDDPTGTNFEIKVEEVSIESLLNEPQNQQDNDHQLNDYDETTRDHTGSGEFVCEICKREFSKLNSRRRHGVRVKIFKCKVCGFSCVDQLQLQMHAKFVHFDIRKYKCNTCGVSFKKTNHLKDHEKTHTNERPFTCSYDHCDKRFKTLGNKLKHNRVHTGEKLYVCEIDGCRKEFNYNETFQSHLQREHGVSALNYSCHICWKLFDMKTKLIIHMKKDHPNHTDEL